MTVRPEVMIKRKGRLEAMRIDAWMVRVAQVVDIWMSQGLRFRGGIRRRDRQDQDRTAGDGGDRRWRKGAPEENQDSTTELKGGEGENGRGGKRPGSGEFGESRDADDDMQRQRPRGRRWRKVKGGCGMRLGSTRPVTLPVE